MSIENISDHIGAHPTRKGYLDSKQKVDTKGKEKKSDGVDSSDRVEISETGKRLAEQDSSIQKVERDSSQLLGNEIRPDKIRQAKIRSRTGHYNKKVVLEKIVDYLLKAGVAPADSSSADDISNTAPNDHINIRWEKIEEVELKISKGVYDQRDILESIVRKLLS